MNTVGLRRAGFSDDDVAALKDAVKKIWFTKGVTFNQAIAGFDLMNGINPQVKHMIEFLHRRNAGKNGRYLESLRTSPVVESSSDAKKS